MSKGFRPEEIVRVQGKDFPVIGGRLRLAHEEHREKLSITTELIKYQLEAFAIARATVETGTGKFTATATATAQRDPKLVHSLPELAESRAVARALRHSGYGTECCGFEELSADTASTSGGAREGTPTREEPDLRSVRAGARPGRPTARATGAQVRALEVLARGQGVDVESLLGTNLPGSTMVSLTLEQASELITRLRDSTPSRAAGSRR